MNQLNNKARLWRWRLRPNKLRTSHKRRIATIQRREKNALRLSDNASFFTFLCISFVAASLDRIHWVFVYFRLLSLTPLPPLLLCVLMFVSLPKQGAFYRFQNENLCLNCTMYVENTDKEDTDFWWWKCTTNNKMTDYKWEFSFTLYFSTLYGLWPLLVYKLNML